MKHMHTSQQHKQQELRITGWEEGILMPRNMNISQLNTMHTKALSQINRKQFIQRRRKHEKQTSIENNEPNDQGNHPSSSKMYFNKKYNTINNDKFSSINQLRKQMQNIQKIKDRWQQGFIYTQTYQKSKNLAKISQSSLIKAYEGQSDEQNQEFDIHKTYIRQVSSCRSNRKRPASSFRAKQKHSITLSQRNNERSKTIHSRGSNRMLSCKNRNLKLRLNSNKLNITINQIQGKKMQSILKILWNHS